MLVLFYDIQLPDIFIWMLDNHLNSIFKTNSLYCSSCQLLLQYCSHFDERQLIFPASLFKHFGIQFLFSSVLFWIMSLSLSNTWRIWPWLSHRHPSQPLTCSSLFLPLLSSCHGRKPLLKYRSDHVTLSYSKFFKILASFENELQHVLTKNMPWYSFLLSTELWVLSTNYSRGLYTQRKIAGRLCLRFHLCHHITTAFFTLGPWLRWTQGG